MKERNQYLLMKITYVILLKYKNLQSMSFFLIIDQVILHKVLTMHQPAIKIYYYQV